MCIDGLEIGQSDAILNYLEERAAATGAEASLLPAAAADRAKVRQICACIGCDTQPVQNLRVLVHVSTEFGGEKGPACAKKKAWAKKFIELGMGAVEKLLADTAGKCCFGDTVTLADAYLVPQVYNAIRWGADMKLFPKCLEVNDYLEKLPAFIAADPASQPDAQ
jgi:maleylacetoacetate isomerase